MFNNFSDLEEIAFKFKDKYKSFAIYKLEDNHTLLQKKIIAFAGLGFNKKFFDQLGNYGFDIVKTIDYPDHHQYSLEDIYSLLEEANSLDAHLITTEKDHIRIPNDFKKSINFIKGQIIVPITQILKRFKKILIKFFIDLLLFLSFKLVKILLNFIGFNNTSLLGGYLFKKIGPVTRYHQIIKSNMQVIYKDEEKIKSFAIRNLEQTGKTFLNLSI